MTHDAHDHDSPEHEGHQSPHGDGHSHGGDYGAAGRRRFAVLTSSDAGAAGNRADTSGDAIEGMLTDAGFEMAHRVMVPDERDQISEALRDWADGGDVDLIVTTGGTGLGLRDVTPEATTDVIVENNIVHSTARAPSASRAPGGPAGSAGGARSAVAVPPFRLASLSSRWPLQKRLQMLMRLLLRFGLPKSTQK